MHKLTVLFLLTLLSGVVRSQNIYSAIQLNEEREYKTRKPKKIIETNTFFNSSGKNVNKSIKTFDDSGMLLTEERYGDNGALTARLAYANDTINRIKLSRVFERWAQQGYSKETAFYTYDKNQCLIGTTDKDAKENVIRRTNLVCDGKGNPIELSVYDSDGNSFGKETAQYLYDQNKVVTYVFDNEGSALSSDTTKISFSQASKFPAANEVYNANGDLTNWATIDFSGRETTFEQEYTYDSFGNCTEKRIFKVTAKGNGKRKRQNDRIFKKEYVY